MSKNQEKAYYQDMAKSGGEAGLVGLVLGVLVFISSSLMEEENKEGGKK